MMNASRRRSCRRLAGLALAGTLSLAACRDEQASARGSTDDDVPIVLDTTELPEGIYLAGDAAADEAPPPAIYYDLTRYDWYARGEPLVHEGRSYTPGGVLAASGAEMRPAGEYGGVAYYRREDGAADSLFVPVFERYWLTFLP